MAVAIKVRERRHGEGPMTCFEPTSGLVQKLRDGGHGFAREAAPYGGSEYAQEPITRPSALDWRHFGWQQLTQSCDGGRITASGSGQEIISPGSCRSPDHPLSVHQCFPARAMCGIFAGRLRCLTFAWQG